MIVGNEVTSVVSPGNTGAVGLIKRMTTEGGIAQEANALGKAEGHADVSTSRWKAEV